jgi:hypothetical protein
MPAANVFAPGVRPLWQPQEAMSPSAMLISLTARQ